MTDTIDTNLNNDTEYKKDFEKIINKMVDIVPTIREIIGKNGTRGMDAALNLVIITCASFIAYLMPDIQQPSEQKIMLEEIIHVAIKFEKRRLELTPPDVDSSK